MKSYYYIEFRGFGNVYNLYWAPADFTPPKTWERISRKKAERYAAEERRRQKEEPSSAFFADSYIWPALPVLKCGNQDEEYEYDKYYDNAILNAIKGRRGWYLDGSYIIRHK